jgi:hypothetical protein
MSMVELMEQLPDTVRRRTAAVWSVFARSLGEQGADGRTALAWRWALTGACPSPLTLSQPTGRPPARSELLAEAAAQAELARPEADPGGQVMHARFVLQWLAVELGALPLWNGGTGSPHVADGVPFARSSAEITDVHSWAMLAEWRYPWTDDPSSAVQTVAHGFARGVGQLLTWTLGAAATGPLTGEATVRPPSLYQVALEVRGAMAGLEHARRARSTVLAGRMAGVMETFAWLTGWSPEPPADRHGHLPADACAERREPCGCGAEGTCLGEACPACCRSLCVHGFAQMTGGL